MTSREQLLANTFVSLADTLVADFDVIDFLHTLATRSVELLRVGQRLGHDIDQWGFGNVGWHQDEHRVAPVFGPAPAPGHAGCVECFLDNFVQPSARAELVWHRPRWDAETFDIHRDDRAMHGYPGPHYSSLRRVLLLVC